MGKNENIIRRISEQGLIPLFCHPDAQVSQAVVHALYKAGIRIVEYTNRGKAALKNFKALVRYRNKHFPDLLLAAGTIKNEKDAKDYINAGADFIICPGVVAKVGKKVHQEGLVWIPGCMTTTEIMLAESCGASLVKLFPGHLLGPAFVRAVKELFPALQFMPTGGVDTSKEHLQAWFDAGVCAVGMGSQLLSKKLLDEKNYSAIEKKTGEALALIQSIRKK
jgi:2-dehydro-3-deoxyphosphogluconate aldolase/(4S)-4-hydroxy-2-oxoglutarate aldolase